jgi:chromosome segregation ATPase
VDDSSIPGGTVGAIAAIGAAITAVVGAIYQHRKSSSSDAVETRENESRVGQISRLERLLKDADAERDEARTQADKLLRELSVAMGEVGILKRDLEHARQEIARYKRRTQRAGGDVTDFAPLDALPPKGES